MTCDLIFLICSTQSHAFCAGVTTIAGGKWGHAGGHVDGPSEDAKFSNDFDVVYVGSSCSLLVVDRGNHAIREIQLHQDDCTTYEEQDYSFNLGIIPCNMISFIYLYSFTIFKSYAFTLQELWCLLLLDSLAICWHCCNGG